MNISKFVNASKFVLSLNQRYSSIKNSVLNISGNQLFFSNNQKFYNFHSISLVNRLKNKVSNPNIFLTMSESKMFGDSSREESSVSRKEEDKPESTSDTKVNLDNELSKIDEKITECESSDLVKEEGTEIKDPIVDVKPEDILADMFVEPKRDVLDVVKSKNKIKKAKRRAAWKEKQKLRKEAEEKGIPFEECENMQVKEDSKVSSENRVNEDFAPSKKKGNTKTTKKPKLKSEPQLSPSPTNKKMKKDKEEEHNVWKWWEEEKRDDGKKWTFLEHKGPVFADPYERLPSNVKFFYDGSQMTLSEDAEEAAGFYAKMLDQDYTKDIFNTNFFKDWSKTMTDKERDEITDLKKCDFTQLHAYYVQKKEERKNRTKEEMKSLKEKNEAVVAEYGWCTIDGHKQRIGNFKIEPPGLFRGRGEHPQQGRIKKRTMPEEVIINCSKDSNIPKPPAGHTWKEVRHDPSVTWLACWNENIQHKTKYVMVDAASKLKGEMDWQKFETARKLHKSVDKIRKSYRMDWKNKDLRIRQRGVALYFIDKLALRTGHEKDEDQADTVGCCSLRYEHIQLHEENDGKKFVVVFDFLGKDYIRYYNEVSVEKMVFKNLKLFMENKHKGDDIFDKLNTQTLNNYLNELLDGLTAKVFRTYNASRTLQEQLEKVTTVGDPIPAQILSYNRANREVAILCNHQRAVPKTFDKSMANLTKKIKENREVLQGAKKELNNLKKAVKHGEFTKDKMNFEKKKNVFERLKEQLDKLEISARDKEENKHIALGTSKLNYLDPRITVAWCKKNGIPIDKVYSKTQRQKFQWAIDMTTADFNFLEHDKNDKFKDKQKEELEKNEIE